MPVKGNKGQQEVVRNVRLYTGIAPFKVIAVNPDKEHLVKIGINAQKEPEYLVGDRVRVDFWLETQFKPEELTAHKLDEQIKTKLSTFLGSKFSTNAAETKYEWINSFGITAWSKDGDSEETPPDLPWFKLSKERKAYVGEGQLINFIVNWINSDTRKDEVSIDNWENLFKGDVTEIRGIYDAYKDNIIRCMMDVRTNTEGRSFHEIYPYYFTRWNQVDQAGWHKHFTNMQSRGKLSNITFSYEIKIFKPTEAQPDIETIPSSDEVESEWS